MAVISQKTRPVLAFDLDGRLEKSQLSSDGTHLLGGASTSLEAIGRSVGCVEAIDHPTLSWLGVAFVVGPGLVMTTAHVSDVFLNEREGHYQLKNDFKVRVSFSDVHAADTRALPIVECMLRHPVLDLALLRIGNDGREPLRPLAFYGTDDLAEGTPLAVIAFFSRDSREKPGLWPAPDMMPGTKYLAPGKFLSFQTWQKSWALAYDCSTSVGSSGGPVIDLHRGDVVGVHRAGEPFKANYAVPASEIARDGRVRDQGLIFTEASLSADPLAFAADWRVWEDRTQVTDDVPLRSRDNLIDIVDKRLADMFPTLDAAVEFIRDQSRDHANTVDSQPGRGRVDSGQYRRALVEALDRRSLLDKRLLEKIGLAGEAASDDADPHAPRALQRTRAPIGKLSAESLDELDKAVREPSGGMEAVIRGSPYVELLTEADGTMLSFQKALRQLAISPHSRSREALVWLLDRARLDQKGVEIPAVTSALTTLGVNAGEPDMLRAVIPGPTDLVDLSFLRKGQTAARSVCVVKFMSAAGSTGWLLAPDLVVAPAHIMDFATKADQKKLASIDDVNPDAFEVEFEDKGANRKRTVHKVSRVESLDHHSDLMILRLDKPLTDRMPLQLRTDRIDSGPVAMIHHPNLGRRMLSIHGGRLLSNDGHETRYLLASAPGSAGAPVFDETWHVVATHRVRLPAHAGSIGAGFVKLGTSMQALVDHVRSAPSYNVLWRTIVGAQRQLRSIDPSLLSPETDDDTSRPVVITLVDESTEVPELKGLSICMRSGDLVTATATVKAVQRLAETPGIVRIDSSRPIGGLECRMSMPFIGVPVIHTNWGEEGDRAVIAVIDNGIDPFHHAFLDAAGRSRIDLYWDQKDGSAGLTDTTATRSPDGAAIVAKYDLKGGMLYTGSDIDALMADPLVSLRENVAHGTAVASIAAGRRTGDRELDFSGGVAPRARLIIIRYDTMGASIGYSVGHINALELINRRATDLGLPVVVNISNGMNAGAHNGTADVEKECSKFTGMSSTPGRIIVKSAGNERNTGRHAHFTVTGADRQLRWNSRPITGQDGTAPLPDRLELWFGSHNVYEFKLQTPDRTQWYPIPADKWLQETLDTRNSLHAHYSQYAAETKMSKLVLTIHPGKKTAVQSGEWTLLIQPLKYRGVDDVHAWLELNETRDIQFKNYVEVGYTITVPGTSDDVITVAAMAADAQGMIFENGSMGPTLGGVSKPDMVAPGVKIAAARAGTRGEAMPNGESGTSFAAPHVSGVIALALSAFQKMPPSDGASNALAINQHFIRGLLLNSSRNFSLKGDPESGFGQLDATEFFRIVRDKIERG